MSVDSHLTLIFCRVGGIIKLMDEVIKAADIEDTIVV